MADGSGRPIVALFDLLGRRWTLRVVWELAQDGRALCADLMRLEARADRWAARTASPTDVTAG